MTSRINCFKSNSETSTAPLDILDSHSHIGIRELVFGKGSSTGQDNNTTPLHVAAEGGHTGLAELLYASVEAIKKDQNTSLLDAALGAILERWSNFSTKVLQLKL